ncbi:hypothetical protein [Tahibacter amnicola]|uniref:Uncharacterized protein n=1 Tax=Tahibacter amnicola TaxID=2976241 RepID=A0ABY6B947_9GAMM|nr:hypothetical protein [Tahibacter amnicola]UXI66529.1 hypothetical protein N4264_17465 [Tahibacter amnicola]
MRIHTSKGETTASGPGVTPGDPQPQPPGTPPPAPTTTPPNPPPAGPPPITAHAPVGAEPDDGPKGAH